MARRIDQGLARLAVVACLGGGACGLGPVRAGGLASPGCMAGGAPVTVAAVDEALDIRLADGRILRLPGVAMLAPSDPTRRDLAAWLTQGGVTATPLGAEPDRWGRTVALVFAAPPGDPGRPVSVVEALVDAGRVLARPDPALNACWNTELQLEHEAERQHRGVWATPPMLTPGDVAALQGRAGSFVLVAGRVAAVRDGRARTYLRFADATTTGMAATLAPSLVRRLVKAGTDPHGWAGRRLRVRGWLDNRWGWQVDVTEPQQLEIDPP